MLSLVLFLHFLNISIDPTDQTPYYLPEDLSINEIESITELITEDLLGLDDFFGESDEEDSDKTSVCNLYFVLDNKPVNCAFQGPVHDSKPTLYSNQSSILNPTRTISTPPPRVA